MDIGLADKRVLVTGGTRGIGAALTRAFAHAGAHVVACSRTGGEAADALARELKDTRGDHHMLTADVTCTGDVAELAAECRDRLGGLDVVVNNAGGITRMPFAELGLNDWHHVIDTNLTSAYDVIRQTLPLLGASASIIGIGSGSAMAGITERSHYTAAKAGLIGLTRSLSREFGPRGIRVNLISPGVVQTEQELPGAVRERYEGMTALQRLGTPAEVAAVAVFLASDMAAYVTGTVIHVDGGI